MPRPLNWIRGEGTVKNQRWGMGEMTPHTGFGCVCGDISGMGDTAISNTPGQVPIASATVINCPGDPACPGYVTPGSDAYIQSLQDELANLYDITTGQLSTPTANVPVPATTIGQWMSNNPMLLAAGVGLVAVLMFSGRR